MVHDEYKVGENLSCLHSARKKVQFEEAIVRIILVWILMGEGYIHLLVSQLVKEQEH